MEAKFNIKHCGSNDDEYNRMNYSSMVHSKKIVKHALRQQVKRRRKNTTIASGNSRSLPKIIQSLPSAISTDLNLSTNNNQHNPIAVEERAVTMKEVLASLPGFSIKSNRRRSIKRLSVAAQLEAGLVDLESPASILANTSLRVLLNRHTFQGLPPLYQRKLAQLLPVVDRQDAATSGLNNEFFARACQEWRKRLAEGEFTPENQQRLKMEAERDKHKLDPWKLKHFEPIWGEKRELHKLRYGLHCINKEQKFTKFVAPTNSRPHEATLNQILDHQSSNRFLIQEKMDYNLDRFEESHSSSLKDQRNTPEFDVTLRIIEGDEEEEENEEDEDDEDEDEEDEDDEDDEDEDDDVEEYEEEEDEEIETDVSLSFINQNNRQCRTIIISNTSHEQLYKQQKIISNIPIIEKTKCSKGSMVLDFISDKKFLDGEVKEEKDDINRRNVENSFTSSTKDFRYFSDGIVDDISQKQADCSIVENQDQLVKLSQTSKQSEVQIYTDSVPSLKFSAKQESFSNHTNGNNKIIEKKKLLQDSALCFQENDEVICKDSNNVTTEIAGVIEIDNETLQRIHELEVRGEMQDAYEEISGCAEEIIYPILDEIEINPNSNKSVEKSIISQAIETQEIDSNVNIRTEEEALQEANNYVCSEMLDCSWTHNTDENSVSIDKGELQVPWPLVAAALESTESTNVDINSSNDCNELSSIKNAKVTFEDESESENSRQINCIQLPVSAFNSDALKISSPVTSCLMKNVHTTQSSSIITFPQLQSIRFVQTNLQTTIEHNSSKTILNSESLDTQNENSGNLIQQLHNDLNTSVQEVESCKNSKSSLPREVIENIDIDSEFQNDLKINKSINLAEDNIQTESTVVLQQQTLLPLTTRQIITSLQPHQQCQSSITTQGKLNRNAGLPNTQRSLKNGAKDQSGRLRNITKEPPGAVNLERSYQICQAVIASSPNRDQLKAHLKPPPSLLIKGEKFISNNKFGSRNINSTKSHKHCYLNQSGTIIQNKLQGVMLKHIFTTSQENSSEEILENITTNQLDCNSTGGIGQYILVKRTGATDNAPRASSAPPMPPHIAGMNIGVHILRGRPASAGESSHQVIALKSKGIDFHDSICVEPDNPNIIIEHPPSPCECNIQGAMVICRQCGAFCHDSCISSQCICAICLIP